jgi:hypothetical protein
MVIYRDLSFNQPYYFMFIYGLIRLLYYLPMERMKKENKIHLEWAKVYWPQDYEVVDELKKLKEENKKLEAENFILWIMFFIFFVFSVVAAISCVYYKLN